jgi:hypothetical protein
MASPVASQALHLSFFMATAGYKINLLQLIQTASNSRTPCFVMMPFTKKYVDGKLTDFDTSTGYQIANGLVYATNELVLLLMQMISKTTVIFQKLKL